MKNKLYYTKKAKYFEQSLPVGNGRMGALVFGNLKKERIAINEDSLWSGYPKDARCLERCIFAIWRYYY